ncbi:GAF and ANTAR domain-containing protein [Herbiconiux sp. CPCC 203407]|uniref:GAF and ANTAR domain-containing protein n=1 Tax=Herbiconiux oxytropis TaxID=2970915 RepID=A0AA41XFD8_9MICO|nr:GAF and ANTAR domain-containing protein [Herbiconiux oxytropis]MCS5721031.1 GAF and ANTAR domain-containing protein [Herbiconiux oxytropis]MCS5724683.1 GAF and ANTAR domain-containing protein [Herbiconiux oxytropis]
MGDRPGGHDDKNLDNEPALADDRGSIMTPTFCAPFLASLPISRAAVSTLKNPFDVQTICASDDLAARLDELQLDLGEGPCWEALNTRAPVLVPDVQSTQNPAWPSLHNAIAASGIHGVFAFPLVVGTLEIGAVDLYVDTKHPFTVANVERASALANVAAVLILDREMRRRPEYEGDPLGDGPYSRREVHQATGMVVSQTGVNSDDALLLIRARAFADGKPVREIAAQVIARQLTFPS